MLKAISKVFRRASPLDPYREAANDYYATREYQERAQEIQSLIQEIRGKVIAIDIEGTILCLELADENEVTYATVDRLRRPFANELLQALAENRQNKIWTGAKRKHAKKLLKSAAIRKPLLMDLIAIETYRPILHAHVSQIKGHIDRVCAEKNIRPDWLHHRLQEGKLKVPRLLGVDFLLDDAPFSDDVILEKLYGDEEAQKLVMVPEFKLKGKNLATHHLDTGLLEAVQALHKKVHQ